MNNLLECKVHESPKGHLLIERATSPILMPESKLEMPPPPKKFPANIFTKIQSVGHIDASGIANPSLMKTKLPVPLESSNKRLSLLVKTALVFPDKKLKEIPERKRELVERALEALEKGWNSTGASRPFPFILNKERTHLTINISFCYQELLEFIEGLSFVNSLEGYGGAIPYILGEDFFDAACTQLLEAENGNQCARPERWLLQPDDLDVAIGCSSEDFDPYKAEEHILAFLADKISHVETEKPLLHIILRETAFKNIFVSHADFKNPQTLISFQNKCGIDIDLTFSKKIVRTPFTHCHGLRAELSFNKNCAELISLFCEEINPFQCLFDKMGGIYRVFEKVEKCSFERRIPWLLQAMSKGGTLVLGEKKEWVREGLCSLTTSSEIVKLHRKANGEDEHLFLSIVDALNGLSFLLENGCMGEGGKLLETTLLELKKRFPETELGKGAAREILRLLLEEGKGAGHAFLTLQAVLLYLLPFFQSASGLSLHYKEDKSEREGSLILSLQYGDKKRAIQFPKSSIISFSHLSSEDADRWLSLLVKESASAEACLDESHLECVKTLIQRENSWSLENESSRVSHACTLESALLDELSVNWRSFLKSRPLAYLLTNSSFEERAHFIKRVNGRLERRSCLTLCGLETSLKERRAKGEVAKQFLYDMVLVSKTTVQAMKEELMAELWKELEEGERDEVISAFLDYLFIRDPSLGASFLRSAIGRGFPLQKAAPFILKIIESEDIALSPFRSDAARYVIHRMLDESAALSLAADGTLPYKAIVCLQREEKSSAMPNFLKAAGKGYSCPADKDVIACLLTEMEQAVRSIDDDLTDLLNAESKDLCKALVFQSQKTVVDFLSRIFRSGSKQNAYEIFRKLEGSPCFDEISFLKELLLFGLDEEIKSGKGMHVYQDLENGSLAGQSSAIKQQAALMGAVHSLNENLEMEAAYAIASILKGEPSEELDSLILAESVERLVKRNIESCTGNQSVHERLMGILLHPNLAAHIGKDRACALHFDIAEKVVNERKSEHFTLLHPLLAALTKEVLGSIEQDASKERLIKLAHTILSHPQNRVFAKKKPSQMLLHYLYSELPEEIKSSGQCALLVDYISLVSMCEKFPARELLSVLLAALSSVDGESFKKGAQVAVSLYTPQLKTLDVKGNAMEIAEGVCRLASSSIAQSCPDQLLLICRSGFQLVQDSKQRAGLLLNMRAAGFSRLEEILKIISQSGFQISGDEVFLLIIALMDKAAKEELVRGIDHLIPLTKESSRIADYFTKELSFRAEELIECAINLDLSDAFAGLIELFDLHSFLMWKRGIHLLEKQSRRCNASFVAFFTGSLGKVNEQCASDYLTLLGKLSAVNKGVRAVFPLNFLEEAMHASSFLEDSERVSAQIMALDAYYHSIQRKQDSDQLALFWKAREALSGEEKKLTALDAQALMQMVIPVKTACAASFLKAAVRLYLHNMMTRALSLKALALLESLSPSEEWNDQAYGLSRNLLEDRHLKGEERVRILKAANPYLLLYKDTLSLHQSISAVFEAVERSEFLPKGLSVDIPLSESLALMPLDLTSELLANRQLTCIFSSLKIKEALSSFLLAATSQALTTRSSQEVVKALAEYEKYFYKLDTGSAAERKITSEIIQLYALLMSLEGSHKMTVGHFTCLATETLRRVNATQFSDFALDVLLWCPDKPFVKVGSKELIKAHITNRHIQRFKERFFEMAKEMINVFLSLPPNGEKQSADVLNVCVSLVSNIMRANVDRGERLLPEFERMLFSPLCMESYALFITHLKDCKQILAICIEKGYMKSNAQLFYTSLLFLENKDWINNPFDKKTKKQLVNSVLDYLLDSKKYFAIHHAINILQTSSQLLFLKDDPWRRAVFLKLINAAFYHPTAKVIVITFDDQQFDPARSNLSENPMINLFFSSKQRELLEKEGGRLSEDLLLSTVAECMVSGERQLIWADKESSLDNAFSLIKAYCQRMAALLVYPIENGPTAEELLKILFKFLTRARMFDLFPSDEAFFSVVEECSAGSIFNHVIRSQALMESFCSLLRLPVKDGEVFIRRLELYHKVVKIMLRSETREWALKGKLLLEEGIKANVYQGHIKTITADPELKELLDKLLK